MSLFSPNRKCIGPNCIAFAREGLMFCVEHDSAPPRKRATWIREHAERPERVAARVARAKER